MKHHTLGTCIGAAGLLFVLSAGAHEKTPTIVQFSGAIGSQPFASGAGGAVVPNDVALAGVAAVNPGGRPWELRRLRASVDVNGMLRARGEGLLLGGGANIGRPAIPRNIQATLYCNVSVTAAPTFAAWNSEAAALDAAGNFSIHGTMTAAATGQVSVPPNPCNLPVLLIRNSAAATTPGGTPTPGPWFAAGIVRAAEDD